MSERQRSQRPRSQRHGHDERRTGAAPAPGTARTTGATGAAAPAAAPAAADERALTRWLAGEMGDAEAAAFAARLEAEPALAGAAARRRRAWRALEVPEDAPGESVPPGFTGRVMAHVRAEAGRRAGLGSPSPRASRLAGTAALVAGLVVGLGLAGGSGPVPPPAAAPATPPTPATVTASAGPEDLAAAYGGLYADLRSEGAADAGDGTAISTPGAEATSSGLADDYTAVLAAAFAGEEGT